MSAELTTVVNIKDIDIKQLDVKGTKYIYIGRDFTYSIPGLVQSKYYNPYSISVYGAKVMPLYFSYMESNTDLLTSIKKELKGCILVCHCKPNMCHGDLLAIIANSDLEPIECIRQAKKNLNLG